MTAVRHAWMFRTAAIVHVFFGMAAAWKFGFTDYDAAHRPLGVGLGVLVILVGVFLFKPAKLAMVLSAIGSAVIAISAAVGVPVVKGPAILAFALVALVFGLYAVFTARILLGRTQ